MQSTLGKTSAGMTSHIGRNWRKRPYELPISYARVALLLFSLFFACGGALGQVIADDKYSDPYNVSFTDDDGNTTSDVSTITIAHKRPKWTQYR